MQNNCQSNLADFSFVRKSSENACRMPAKRLCPENALITLVTRLKKAGSTTNPKQSCGCQQWLYAYLSCKKLFQLSLLLFLRIRSKKIRKSKKVTSHYTVSMYLAQSLGLLELIFTCILWDHVGL